jgi:hypothetical protein
MRETFGTVEFDQLSQITKGHTNSLVYRLVVAGSPYLLKIITRNENPSRHYACMKEAAEAGLAPRVLYTNTEDKISITAFVVEQPLAIADARVRLAALLRKLHALPPFARAPFNTTCTFLLAKGPALDGWLQKFRESNALPPAEAEEFSARYQQLAEVLPYDDAEMVSSHNDLFKPDNILFDGQRVQLVDWEAAFLNDRYVDLAALASQVVANEQEEIDYLREYFGAPPDSHQRARFHLMQQLSHLFCTMAFLYQAALTTAIDWSSAVPTLSDFHRRMWAGEENLTDTNAKAGYGRAHWERLRHNVMQPRYEESLRIVSGRHATA